MKVKNKDPKRKVIIKRIRRVEKTNQVGLWKIAYADFMTALMAFFLLLWLLSAVPLDVRLEVSKYFQRPLMVVLTGGQTDDLSKSVVTSTFGDDKTKESGQVSLAEKLPRLSDVLQGKDLQRLLHEQEVARLQMLKHELEQVMNNNPELSKYKNQLRIEFTTEGLRILIIDEKNRPMFKMGSDVLQPYTVEILKAIGNTLNQVPNKIGLSGHTDATPYEGGNVAYSNWELSADRANASRRELIAGGMDQSKVLRVVGLSSSMLFNPDNPFDPNNRRISIIVMNKEAENSILQNGPQ